VTAASAVALVLAAVALAVALVAASHIRAQGHVLSRRLVPAAAAAGDLLDDYQAQQTWLRGYVTDGRGGTLAPYNELSEKMRNVQDELNRLAVGDRPIIAQLNATVTAGQAWLADVADPQLRAMRYGFFSTAQALQNDTGQVRPYVLAIRSAGAALQAQITDAQRAATDKLNSAQGTLLATLIGLCVAFPGAAAGRRRGHRRGLRQPHPGGRPAGAGQPGPRHGAHAAQAGRGPDRARAGRAAFPAHVRYRPGRNDRGGGRRVDRDGEHPGRPALRVPGP
jgi:CHASE3 domain sensor protein